MIDRFAAAGIMRSPRQSYLPPGVSGEVWHFARGVFPINTASAGPLPNTPPALCQNITDRSVGVSVHVVADNKHLFESNICQSKLFENKCTDEIFAFFCLLHVICWTFLCCYSHILGFLVLLQSYVGLSCVVTVICWAFLCCYTLYVGSRAKTTPTPGRKPEISQIYLS
jgi:hypothetical protein